MEDEGLNTIPVRARIKVSEQRQAELALLHGQNRVAAGVASETVADNDREETAIISRSGRRCNVF